MAGGCSKSHMNWSFEVCQLCEQSSHTAILCPFLYSKCMYPGCIGIRMLLTSESNLCKGKKFLKCQFPNCESGIQWLDEVLKGKGSTSAKCCLCDEDGHSGRDCPWNGVPCKNPTCNGTRNVKISGTEDNPGKKFLLCSSCHCFEWLVDAMAKHEAIVIQEQLIRKSPGSGKCKGKAIEDLCHEFAKKSQVDTLTPKKTLQDHPKCYSCNAAGHMANMCPWKASPCLGHGCTGTMKLCTSGQQHSYGLKYLKCAKCAKFVWLHDVMN